jgi:AmiR/NasT family two-component response regulator
MERRLMESTTPETSELQVEADPRDILIANLRIALEGRDIIGQAKGVIMSSAGCTADEAFDRLVEQSQRENRKVVDIAAEIAASPSARPA